MPKTFLNLQNDLATWLSVDEVSLPTAVRKDIINIAQREFFLDFNTKFNEVESTLALIQGQEDYSVPTGFKHHISFWYTNAQGSRIDLEYKNKPAFDDLHPDTSVEGEPAVFTIWADNLRIGPTPDAAYTLNTLYYNIPADLVADGDTNKLTNEAWEVLLWGALKLSESFGVNDERMPMWNTLYIQATRRFASESKRSTSFRFQGRANVSK